MKKTSILAICLIVVSAALAVVSMLLLPDIVTTQISISGSNPTTMPKLLAVALPTALSLGGAIVALCVSKNTTTTNKALIASVIGIAVFGIMLIVNL